MSFAPETEHWHWAAFCRHASPDASLAAPVCCGGEISCGVDHVWINALFFCFLQVTTQTENGDFQTPDEMDFSDITGSNLMDSAPPMEKVLSVCEMVISGSIT